MTGLDNWREQLRRGGLDLAILLTIAPEPRYGLQILRELEDTTDLIVTEGTLYPILARLTRDGMLQPEWVTGESAHPRKYYRMTAAGRTQLEQMLSHWQAFTQKIAQLQRGTRRQR